MPVMIGVSAATLSLGDFHPIDLTKHAGHPPLADYPEALTRTQSRTEGPPSFGRVGIVRPGRLCQARRRSET
jgi:hypothetical protein